jgi:hypothetical protein
VSLGAAGRNWVSLWQGFDQLAMSVDQVEFDEEERQIIVSTTFVNESDEQLQIHVLDTGLRLSGRSITAGSERYTQLILDPAEEVHLQTTQRVHGQDVTAVREQINAGGAIWNVSGRVQVSVEGLSEPLWLPFRYEIEAQ